MNYVIQLVHKRSRSAAASRRAQSSTSHTSWLKAFYLQTCKAMNKAIKVRVLRIIRGGSPMYMGRATWLAIACVPPRNPGQGMPAAQLSRSLPYQSQLISIKVTSFKSRVSVRDTERGREEMSRVTGYMPQGSRSPSPGSI